MVCMWRSEDNSGNISMCAHTFPCRARGLNFDKIQPIFKQTNKTLHASVVFIKVTKTLVLVLRLGSVIHLELNLANSEGLQLKYISSSGGWPTLAVADKTTLPY